MKVKFCGITRPLDYEQAVAVGADFVGYIFHPPSPRYVDEGKRELLLKKTSKNDPIKKVGVFVNESIKSLINLVEVMELDVVQIHGDEDLAYLNLLQTELNKLAVKLGREILLWHCVKLGESLSETINEEVEQLKQYPSRWLLLERKASQLLYGGTGQVIAVEPLLNFVAKTDAYFKFILAGGLNKDNIVGRVNLWRESGLALPEVLDFNSGVELSPGVKSPLLMKEVMGLINQLND